MEIVTLVDTLLRKRSILVNDIDQGIKDFIEAMFDTMHSNKGIGLAAVQVGHLFRIFVTHVPDDIPRVFINPDIVETSLEQNSLEEGCLSIPGINADITRSAAVKVQAWNERDKPLSLSAEGLLARVIQHEVDHLNGRLFIDHLNSKKRNRLLKEYDRKFHV
jgi:peptide deformylase